MATAGGRTPPWMENEPGIDDCDRWLLPAFWDLDTCRPVGMEIGPIPWRDMILYADAYHLDPDNRDMFTTIIREMDRAFLVHDREERKHSRGNNPSGGPAPGAPTPADAAAAQARAAAALPADGAPLKRGKKAVRRGG